MKKILSFALLGFVLAACGDSNGSGEGSEHEILGACIFDETSCWEYTSEAWTGAFIEEVAKDCVDDSDGEWADSCPAGAFGYCARFDGVDDYHYEGNEDSLKPLCENHPKSSWHSL